MSEGLTLPGGVGTRYQRIQAQKGLRYYNSESLCFSVCSSKKVVLTPEYKATYRAYLFIRGTVTTEPYGNYS